METRKSAEAAREAAAATLKQAQLAEAAMHQWIHLDDWGSSVNEISDKLNVTFSVYNPTNFLVMTEHGNIKLKNLNVKSIFIYRRSPLAPNKPVHYELNIPVSKTWIANYKAGNWLGSPIEGSITFTSALGKRISQDFVGVLSFSLTETKCEPHVRIGPYLPSPEKQDACDTESQHPN